MRAKGQNRSAVTGPETGVLDGVDHRRRFRYHGLPFRSGNFANSLGSRSPLQHGADHCQPRRSSEVADGVGPPDIQGRPRWRRKKFDSHPWVCRFINHRHSGTSLLRQAFSVKAGRSAPEGFTQEGEAAALSPTNSATEPEKVKRIFALKIASNRGDDSHMMWLRARTVAKVSRASCPTFHGPAFAHWWLAP